MDEWSNGSCLGYAISALETLNYTKEEIREIVNEIKFKFDIMTVKEAEAKYCKSSY